MGKFLAISHKPTAYGLWLTAYGLQLTAGPQRKIGEKNWGGGMRVVRVGCILNGQTHTN